MPRTLGSPAFVGRREELRRLAAALDHVKGGEPRTVVLGGEAGVGKTRLLTEFTRTAEAGGAQVLRGGCIELGEASLPYAPVVEALRGLARRTPRARLDALLGSGRGELARLLPELGPAEPRPASGDPLESAQLGLFDRLLALLVRLGEQAPLALIVEDLHWSDRSTRDLLAFLVHSLADARVLLLATFRSDELSRQHPLRPFLARLERDEHVERLDLAPFDRPELVEFLAGLLGEPPAPDLVDEVFERSQGNAFFTEELAAAAADGASPALPDTVRDALLSRVDALPAAARSVLRVAAAAGADVDHELLAEVARMEPADLLGAVRAAVAEQILVVQPDTLGYRFRHALAQEAIHDDLLPGERVDLHRRLAAAIEARPELAGRMTATAALAWHWRLAHDQPKALVASLAAGREAACAFAFAGAQREYEAALELWDAAPDAVALTGVDRVEVLKRAAAAATRAGEYARGEALAGVALAQLDPHTEPERAGLLWMWRSRALENQGDERYAAAMEEAVRLVPADPPTAARARVLGYRANQLMLQSCYGESERISTEAAAVARAVEAPIDEAFALVTLGLSIAFLGRTDEGVATLRAAEVLARRVGDLTGVARAAVNLGETLQMAGEWEAAVQVSLEGVAMADARSLGRTYGAMIRGNAAEVLLKLGRWDEAEALTRQALALHDRDYQGTHVLHMRALLLLGRGRHDEARQHLERALSIGRTAVFGPQYMAVAYATLAELALRQGLAEALLAGRDTDARAQAIAALRSAAAVAERLEAVPLAQEATRVARRGGVDLDGADAPAQPWGLTAREAEVLRLAAAGRSNREIGAALWISAKTASVHVSNILAKLGVHSRVEAAALALREGFDDGSMR